MKTLKSSLKSPVTSITTQLCLVTGGHPFKNRNDRVVAAGS